MITTFDQSMQLKKIGIIQTGRLLYVTGPEFPVPVIYDETIPGQGLTIHCSAFTDAQLIAMIGDEPDLQLHVDIESGLTRSEFNVVFRDKIATARIAALFEILIDTINSLDQPISEINSRILEFN